MFQGPQSSCNWCLSHCKRLSHPGEWENVQLTPGFSAYSSMNGVLDTNARKRWDPSLWMGSSTCDRGSIVALWVVGFVPFLLLRCSEVLPAPCHPVYSSVCPAVTGQKVGSLRDPTALTFSASIQGGLNSFSSLSLSFSGLLQAAVFIFSSCSTMILSYPDGK